MNLERGQRAKWGEIERKGLHIPSNRNRALWRKTRVIELITNVGELADWVDAERFELVHKLVQMGQCVFVCGSHRHVKALAESETGFKQRRKKQQTAEKRNGESEGKEDDEKDA